MISWFQSLGFQTGHNLCRYDVHFHTKWGRAQRKRMGNISQEINQRIAYHFDRISLAVEELKYAGQPGNESSRMRQYVTVGAVTAVELSVCKPFCV